MGAARIARWAAGAVLGLLVLVTVGVFGLDTQPGHRLLVGLVARQAPADGLRIGIGRIDGSIYGRMTLRELAIRDTQGVFLTSPALTIDWRPTAWLFHKHLRLGEVTAETLRLLRRPRLAVNTPGPNQPILPNYAITVSRLHVGALILEPAVTGDRRALALDGRADIAAGHARIAAQAEARTIDGHAGGDRLTIDLDAQPGANRLRIDAHLAAPAGGVLSRMAGLNAPLSFDLHGRGDWRDWRGHAVATLRGRPLLDAALTAQSGVFAAKGQAEPGLDISGRAGALLAPAVAFDLSGHMQNRQLDAQVRLASAALEVSAAGRLDLAHDAFSALRIDGRLLKPVAVSSTLTGRDIRVSAAIDGPFARPTVDYVLKAAAIGLDKTVIEDLDIRGTARVDAYRRLRLPIHATASRVLGLDPALAGLATDLRLDGDVLIAKGLISSDDLRLRSDRLDTTVAAKLIPTARGQFRIGGHADLQTRRIDDATALALLGGNATAAADFSRSPDGAVDIADLKLAAPKLHILGGHGRYGTNGAISLVADAVSVPYGPLRLEIAGTAAAPEAHLQAAHPTVGVPLTGLDIAAKPATKGYAVTVQSGSPYGAVAADLGVVIGPGPLTIDIRRASVAGLSVQGGVQLTAAGPFAGTLKVLGDGLGGTVRLAADGKVQRIDAALRAADARLPLAPPLLIARGALNATAILYPGAPAITGEATLSGLRDGELTIATARAKVDYRGGSGHVGLAADGRSGVPFTLAGDAAVSPDLIRVTGQGSIDRIAIKLAGPATVQRHGDDYRLTPVTLVLPQGRLELAGTYGKGASLTARLQDVDVGVLQALAPDLVVGGRASGVIEATLPSGGALPTGRAQLAIANVTRTSPTTVSEPVDVEVLGALTQGGADVHALVRRRGAVIGRLQARLAPIAGAPSEPWLQRLKAAPLSGGLRYDGPAEALWGLSGVAGQTLSGPIAIGADISGRFDRPEIAGVVRAQALRYENASLGARIDDIALDGRFTGDRLEIARLTGKAGSGTLSGSGYADLSAADGFPVDLRVVMNKAQLARSDGFTAVASGSLALTNDRAKGALISGDLSVDQARYEIGSRGSAQAPELTGVRRKGEPLADASAAAPSVAAAGPPSVWKLDIHVHSGDRLFVSGMGLDAEWRSDLRVTGDARRPVVLGDVTLVRGTFEFAGRRLDLSRGLIHLNGSEPPNPTLDLEASATAQDVTATIAVTGTAQAPKIAFTSTPTLPQDEVLSRLLFGTSVTQLSPVQAVQLAAALNALRGGGGLNPLGKLGRLAGIDRLSIVSADTATGQSTAVAAGKYITNKIYIEVTEDARGYTATQIEIALDKALQLLSQVSSFGGSNISLRYIRRY
jgi:translocation and assembly module TamB